MSTSQTITGGVKNLRAIFESRSSDVSTSPPSRGRSPNGSVTSSHSRPLSKIRTSFIAIEKPGASGGPPQLGLRRTSDEVDDSVIIVDMDAVESGLGAILKGSPFEEIGPAKEAVSATAGMTNIQAPKTTGTALKEPAATKKPYETGPKVTSTKPTTNVTRPAATSQVSGGTNSQADTKTSPITPSNQSFPKPRGGGAKIQAVTQSAKEAQEARTANSAFPKPRGGGAKIQAVMESAREAQEARVAAAQGNIESGAKKENSKIITPTTTKAPRASLPARLSRPAGSATAPTAASVAKNEANNASEQKPAERRPTARGPPRAANATTASSLAKKSSRASLGLTEQPKSRGAATTRAPADEGFLARMMRPTASSAQKTHEKVQAESPPRVRTIPKKASRKSVASTITPEADEDDVVEAIPETTEDVSVVPDSQATEVVNGDGQQPQQPEVPATTD